MGYRAILVTAVLLCFVTVEGSAQAAKGRSECAYDAQSAYVVGVLVGLVTMQQPAGVCLPSTGDFISAVAAAVEREQRASGNPRILDGPMQVNVPLAMAFLQRNFPCK
jgi:hypothetical protein